MNELKIFESSDFGKVRTVLKDEQIWFCLSDVCRILEIGNVVSVRKRLSEAGVNKINIGVQAALKKDGTPVIQQMGLIFLKKVILAIVIFYALAIIFAPVVYA